MRRRSMFKKNGSGVLTVLGIVLLALAAVPVLWNRADYSNKQMAVSAGEAWDVPGEIVVDLKDNAGPAEIASLSQSYSAQFQGYDPVGNPGEILTVSTS